MNKPVLISDLSFQKAWLKASKCVADNQWEMHNLLVSIEDVSLFDNDMHQEICAFSNSVGLLGPKHVAYTIFPHKQYKGQGTATRLYENYNKHNGFYDWTRKRTRSGWGTYFRRMTQYEIQGKPPVNQLNEIITAINSRQHTYKAAYTIVIQKPGRETIRPLGGPCLNYIAVQGKSGLPRKLDLLCVYRNHDFLERAYGNYWGLCNLARFIAKETESDCGSITCISSHAYVDKHKEMFRKFLEAN